MFKPHPYVAALIYHLIENSYQGSTEMATQQLAHVHIQSH